MFNSSVKNVSGEEAYKLINDNKELLILDVRTKGEYEDGHISGAKLVPVNVLSMKIDEFDEYKDKPVLVYCASGGRSPGAVDILVNNNFTNVYHLNRGIYSWRYKLTA